MDPLPGNPNANDCAQAQGPPPSSGKSRRKLGLACLILVTLVLLVGGWYRWHRLGPPAPPQVPDNLDPALREALERARERVLREPRSAAAWGKLGMVFHANGMPKPAADCYLHAEELDDADPRWPYYRGLLLRSEPAQALPHLQRALEGASTHDHEIRLCLAETLVELNRNEEAEQIYRHVLHYHPGNHLAHLGLGMLACARQHFSASLPYLLKAAEGPPTKKKAYSLLATVYTRLGKTAEAAQAQGWAATLPLGSEPDEPLRKAVTQQATGKQDRLSRIDRLHAQGQFPEALRAAEELAQDNPDDAWVASALIRALYATGDYARARQVIERSIPRWPRHSPLSFHMGSILFREAEVLAQRRLDMAQAREGFLTAAGHFQKVIDVKPDDSAAYFNLGLCYRYARMEEPAARAFQKALDIRPDYADAHARLAELLIKQGKTSQALLHIHLAIKLTPPDEPKPLLAIVLAGSWIW